MSTFTKAHKIKIINPVNNENENKWEEVGKYLNEINYLIPKVKSKSSTLTLSYILEKLNYEKENGKDKTYFKKKFGKELMSHLEYESKRDPYFKNIDRYYGRLFQKATQIAHQSTTKKIQEILKGNESLEYFKKDQPIPVDSGKVNLTKEGKNYYFETPLLSPNYAQELGRKGRRKTMVKFLLSSKGQEKIVLERILNGQYHLCDSNIQKQGRDWYLIATYQFEKENTDDLAYLRTKQEEEFGQARVLGIDMGIAKAVYMAVSNSPINAYIDGGEIEQFRNKIEYRRNQMRNQLKWASENRRGHGSQTLLKPLEILESKVSNFRKTTNHRYAKYIVEFAVKNQCSIIQMEELGGINERSAFLKRWSYFDLQTKIESKAKEYGIEVIKVDPKFTSQRCYKCGVINKDNRKSQDKYECECKVRNRKGETVNYKINADLNAARNLSVLGIDDIIYEQALHQGLVKPKENNKKKKAS